MARSLRNGTSPAPRREVGRLRRRMVREWFGRLNQRSQGDTGQTVEVTAVGDRLVGIRARKATARPPWTVKRERRAANRRARKSRKANR